MCRFIDVILELIFLNKSQIKDYKIGICCFSAMYATLMIKSKDWLAQINVSNWSDMSTCLHNNNNKNPTKLGGLVQSRYYYHLVIQLKNCSFGVKQQLFMNLNDVSKQEGQSIPNIGEKKIRNRDVRAVYPYKIF